MSEKVNKTKRTALNVIFSTANLLISSILSLVATRTVLVHLGSDYNGLNSTISQFLSILVLFESGFTVAALVKLYKPYGENDIDEVNRILSKTNQTLKKVGFLMASFGLVLSSVYAIFIKTDIRYLTVLLLFLFSVFSTAFNFAYTYKFRLLYQVSQSEYIVYISNILMNVISYVGLILLVTLTENILIARFFYAAVNVLFGVVIGVLAKRLFPNVNYHANCENVKIEGTSDLLFSRIAGLLYNFLTVFYLSVFSGTVITSVYAVYNSVISIVANYVNVFLSAPRNALGAVINSDRNRLNRILSEYDHVVILLISVLFSTTLALIIPFVRFYTADLTDVNYIMPILAFLIVATFAVQLLHIPSGQCIELNGNFKVARNLQIGAVICLVTFSTIGVIFFDLVGLIAAKLLTGCFLAVTEIYYAHFKIAPGSFRSFLVKLVPNLILFLVLVITEYHFLFHVNVTIVTFILAGFIVVAINASLVFLLNFFLFRRDTKAVLDRLLSMLKKRKKTSN